MKRVLPFVAAAAAGALALSACGSDSGDSSGGGSDGPIKLLVISQLHAELFSFPEIEGGAKAAAESINAAGGVNGHKIQIDLCNDQGNPNVAATCGRKAVSGGYAAVLNPTSLYSASFMPLLEAGKIPAFGSTPLTEPDYTSSVSFPISGGNVLDYGGSGMVAAEQGCKSAGIISDTTAGALNAARFQKKGYEVAGGKTITTHVKTLATSPDFAATVSQITSSGVDCILLAQTPDAIGKVLNALAQSNKPDMRVFTNASSAPPALIKSLGNAAKNLTINGSVAIPTETTTPTFWADMTKYAPKFQKTSTSGLAWAGVQILAKVAGDAKAYDRESLMTALNNTTDAHAETLAGPLDFSKPRTDTDSPRIFASENWIYHVENAVYVPSNDHKPVDVTKVMK